MTQFQQQASGGNTNCSSVIRCRGFHSTSAGEGISTVCNARVAPYSACLYGCLARSFVLAAQTKCQDKRNSLRIELAAGPAKHPGTCAAQVLGYGWRSTSPIPFSTCMAGMPSALGRGLGLLSWRTVASPLLLSHNKSPCHSVAILRPQHKPPVLSNIQTTHKS